MVCGPRRAQRTTRAGSVRSLNLAATAVLLAGVRQRVSDRLLLRRERRAARAAPVRSVARHPRALRLLRALPLAALLRGLGLRRLLRGRLLVRLVGLRLRLALRRPRAPHPPGAGS